MHVGANSLSTPSSVTTLYVRWSSDHNSKSSATWSGGACASQSPSGTAFQSFQGETATPTTDPTESAPPSSPPSSTPFETFQGETGTPVVTGTPCVVGVGPDAFTTLPPCSTPFESFQGETAFPSQDPTPPSTSTGGDGSSGTATPLFALLLGFAFGGLGFISAQAQRRSIRSR